MIEHLRVADHHDPHRMLELVEIIGEADAVHHLLVFDHEHLRFAVVHDVERLLLRDRLVHAGRAPADHHRAEVCDQPLRVVVRHDRDGVACLETEAQQGAREEFHALDVHLPRQVFPDVALFVPDSRPFRRDVSAFDEAVDDGVAGHVSSDSKFNQKCNAGGCATARRTVGFGLRGGGLRGSGLCGCGLRGGGLRGGGLRGTALSHTQRSSVTQQGLREASGREASQSGAAQRTRLALDPGARITAIPHPHFARVQTSCRTERLQLDQISN